MLIPSTQETNPVAKRKKNIDNELSKRKLFLVLYRKACTINAYLLFDTLNAQK